MKRFRSRSCGVVLVLLAAAVPKVALAELQQVTFRRHSTSGSSSYSGRMSGGGEQQQDANFTRRPRGLEGERYGGSALASVFRLTRKIVEQPSSQQPSSTFFGRLQDRLHVSSHGSRKSDNGSGGRRIAHGNNAITNTTTKSAGEGASTFFNRVARVLKDGLAQSGAGARRGSTIVIVILGVACILSVAAANTIVSHPAGWVRWGARSTNSNSTIVEVVADPLDVGVEGDAGKSRLLSSLKGLGRRGPVAGSERLLAKAPRFPLAYVPWWKAVQDRRKVSTCYYGWFKFERENVFVLR